ncbi:hypothetical protein A2872_01930 [Candidatus Gottesmanbacteria bacterium RIFCSPHIGHO2_01_FULL_42_12]|uniref:Haloacid dehalogenase n=1 Tax=Candidatus Gottesmanbacteria bacterium RIFCSPHIGHO2_01_FULL_42_12 TaxID=1798377 RepID=A0A1F5Z5G7_9BACT|nr:MAG: hypothetical protein A2872_01930 [Candidatus Gottesmanbacteria bacterium RIFCSPHIGHO2_01_FULL_42_12]
MISSEVKCVTFDLDDTLTCTHEIFGDCIDRVCGIMAASLAKIYSRDLYSKVRIKEAFTKSSDSAFETEHVNPNRWIHVLSEMKETFPQLGDVQISICLDLLMGIYKTVPELKTGALPLLESLMNRNINMGLVTHADEDWTKFKLKTTGLDAFFDRENTHIINMYGPKDVTGWRAAYHQFRVRPSECVVVGNSPSDDIIPNIELGVRQAILLRDGPVWPVHETEVPDSVRKIKSLNELI